MTSTILICSRQEDTQEKIKAILAYTFPLIIVTEEDQCMAALKQKAPLSLVFVGTSFDSTRRIFEEMRKASAKLTIIAVGESGSEDEASGAVSRGATGYIMPPLRNDDILALAQKYALRAV